MMRILEQNEDFRLKSRLTSFAKFLFHLIGRNDDTANFETDDLKGLGPQEFEGNSF
jgi:hypothetical protein